MPSGYAGRWTVSPGHQLTGNEAGVGAALDSGAAVGPPTVLPSFVTVGKVSFLPAVLWFSFLKSGNALPGHGGVCTQPGWVPWGQGGVAWRWAGSRPGSDSVISRTCSVPWGISSLTCITGEAPSPVGWGAEGWDGWILEVYLISDTL